MPNLAVVEPQSAGSGPEPPVALAEFGLRLWREVTGSYEFSDPASVMVLAQACQSLDRVERCRRIIDEQGEAVRTNTGIKAHPLLRDEATHRALMCRLLARLGLDLEPVRDGPGRPPGRG